MGSKKGKLLTCDRCGATAFLALNGKNYYDGGYTTTDSFEEAPEGWNEMRIVDVYRTLCPGCDELWQTVCMEFLNGEK